MVRFVIAFILLCGSALLPTSASAQLAAASQEPVTVSVTPAYPRPYETVTVTATSNLIDLAASTISISVNGTVVERGMRSTQVKLGGPGSRSTIRVSAVSPEGTYTNQVVVAPADVSLVVESASLTHPLYEGASLVPSEGRVRVVAVSDLRTAPGTRVPESQLSYVWKVGDKVLETESGLGRNVLIATAPVRYRDAVISVSVSNQSKSVVAQSSVTISPVDPIVRIYQSDPLLGPLFEHALSGSFALSGAEETFHAVPYSFKAVPSLTWSLNGNPTDSNQDLTVRSSGNSGTALLSVEALAPDARATTNLTVRFGESGGSGLFGL